VSVLFRSEVLYCLERSLIYSVSRFIYADQRGEGGEPAYAAVDGPAHAEFYTQLADNSEGVPWLATFVKGKGHVKF
jgi:Mn-containing catalase